MIVCGNFLAWSGSDVPTFDQRINKEAEIELLERVGPVITDFPSYILVYSKELCI